VKYGELLPDPSPLRRGQIAIATTVGFDAKLLLLQTIRAQNVRARDLAARLGITPQEVTRLIDLRHRTKIDAIAAALQALGKRLELSLAA
jgi:antitoxin HicB